MSKEQDFLKDISGNEDGPEYEEYDEFGEISEELPIQAEYKVTEPHKYYQGLDD